ncbi:MULTISPECIES: hypothetical protein [unclassified Rhodococcus (in: high G+C Gram-positive bacteria)]|nr:MULTISPECIES: hypothetical protein [unclassified Rhodococcus (in: high G+C Gram-positive bacteria)]
MADDARARLSSIGLSAFVYWHAAECRDLGAECSARASWALRQG